jgi:hypothetical protein
MNRTAQLPAVLGMALLFGTAAPAQENRNAAEAKDIVKQFADTLQGELKAAISEGGPVKAIAICNKRAPAIAQDLSERAGWSVGRTSLKVRNSKLNTPDAWERTVLEEFDQRQAAGEDVNTMAKAEVVETEDGKVFRFMKAIPTGDLCVACHGQNLTPEVQQALDAAYPNDQARGYKAGQVRGAFTLSKRLD